MNIEMSESALPLRTEVHVKLSLTSPAWLALPTTGPLGQVGTLDVDANTGGIVPAHY